MKDKINPNGNIILNNNEKESMILNISEKFKDIIDILKLDLDSEQIIETPQRVAKMYVEELFSGCYSLEPKITVFPNTKKYDEIIISGPIKVKSMCSHHFMPFFGYAYVGYIPKDKVIGISKFSRIVN
jgi:GTP cyclohydrolase I